MGPPQARSWLLRFSTTTSRVRQFLSSGAGQAKVVPLLMKPGKDPSEAKCCRPISLLCHTYMLFEQLTLSRLTPHVGGKLIPEQTGLRPGRSCTSQQLNLIEHIEDGCDNRQITGAISVDSSAASDTVNHRRLLCNTSFN